MIYQRTLREYLHFLVPKLRSKTGDFGNTLVMIAVHFCLAKLIFISFICFIIFYFTIGFTSLHSSSTYQVKSLEEREI